MTRSIGKSITSCKFCHFKSKEEALAAMKKATDRKRTLIEYLKKGYSLEELERDEKVAGGNYDEEACHHR